jgi:hypothetical protein
MIRENLFGAPGILAIYFATIKDANSMNDSALRMPTLLGVCLIFVIHGIWSVFPESKIHQFINLCQTSISLLLEISLFLILCQSIGKRGSKQYSIPTEYVYLPLLIVLLMVTNRDRTTHRIVESHWMFQSATLIAFLTIVLMYPYSNFPQNMSYPGDSRDIFLLFIALVSIYAIPTQDVQTATTRNIALISSALYKSLVLIIGISCLNTGSTPDPSKFKRLHDFYSIRMVSHFDPQFEQNSTNIWQIIIKDLAGHFTKLVFLATSCVWFGKLINLPIFSRYRTNTTNHSSHEVVVVCTIVFVMTASLAVSKQHDVAKSMQTHSIIMIWAIMLTIAYCIMVVLICSRPFRGNAVSTLSVIAHPLKEPSKLTQHTLL